MFLGVVPKECIQQIFKVMDFSAVRDVHLCCSGTFRLERAFAQLHPEIRVHSNDVSLFSCVIGGLATNKPVDFRFAGELEWVEKHLSTDPIQRAAAVMVAFEMARFARRNNAFNVRHFDFYALNFMAYVERTMPKIESILAALNVTSFFGGDWLEHAYAGIEKDATTLAFPPFTKGGYEVQFKFLNDNVAWDEPSYGLWNPEDLHAETRKLEAAGSKYCILTDQAWEDQEPVLKYTAGLRLPHYCYAHTKASSFIAKRGRAQPFKYRPIEIDKLGPDTKITVVPADGAKMNFIKDVYLAKNIQHVSGSQNFLIYADGMLLGSVIYDEGPKTRMAYGSRTILLLSDLSISRAGKLSKLVASIATSRALIGAMEAKLLKRYERVVTTAFSKHPNSMKYRGVFKKLSRRRNDTDTGFVIQYGAPVTDETPRPCTTNGGTSMDKLETKIERLPLKALKHLEVNARYMTAEQQKRLTENIKRDGGLTSLPLVWLRHDKKGKPLKTPSYEILSGNHRVYSAREAGLEEIDCIVILNNIDEQRRVELQLAHNAVTGQDDLSILEGLYESLSLLGKEYSGLTDEVFKGMMDINLDGLSVAGPDYQDINLSFLPSNAAEFEALLKRAAKAAKVLHYAARIEDFDNLFDAIVRTKEAMNVQNAALAMTLVAELAIERLEQIEAENEAEENGEAAEILEEDAA